MHITKYSYILILVILFSSCQEKEEVEVLEDPKPKGLTTEQSIEINRYWVSDESFKIDGFVKRHNWEAIKTESGIRYYIYQHGNGNKVEKDMLASLNFEVRLLDADTTLCYSSAENGTQTIFVEKDDIESGLHEALKYLHVGDKAYVILPHFAAHGLIGDNYKIPPLSPVLYKIEVLDAKFPE